MGDGYLDPGSQKVQSSVSVLIDSFKNYAPFTINPKDDSAGIPGILVGRYLNDQYNGGNSSQPGGGNPWILCTASLAEIFYRAAELHSKRGIVELTQLNVKFFKQAYELSGKGRASAGYVNTGVSEDELASSIVAGNTISASQSPAMFKSYMDMLTLTGACIDSISV